jgi:hypothetical protein
MATVVLKPKTLDLLPKNPQPVFLKLESTEVKVDIAIETKAPNSAKTDRWTKVAEAEMQRYQDIVVDTTKKITASWDKGKSLSERQKDAAELTKSINNACKTMEAAIEKAVKDQIKREAQGDRNLLEARVVVAAKGSFRVIAIVKDSVEIVGSGGADVLAWRNLAKDIMGLAKLIVDACKDEARLRTDLIQSFRTYSTAKQQRLDEAVKAQDWKARMRLKLKEIWESEKKQAEKVEAQRKKYRNEVSALIQKVDGVGEKREKLLATLKKSGSINAKSISSGNEMVALGRKCKTMNDHILECQRFLDSLAPLLTEAGVQVDDRTVLQKLKQFDGLGSLKDAANALYEAASDIQDVMG